MAAPVLTKTTELTNTPFLIRKFTFTAGTTATAFTHGGPAVAPDIAFATNATTNPTATEVAIYSLTTTQFTLDCEAGSGTVEVYLIWLNQSAGGIS